MATSEQSRRALEPIFIATPPPTPLLHHHSSITRTTTPREMPTMYHFDFATSSTTDPETEDSRRGAEDDLPAPPPLTSGSTLPVPEYVPEQSTQLTPCPCCSRTFVVDALRKHVVICEKASKKRKIFDSSRQRRDGTALSTYVLPKNFGLPGAERTVGIPSPPITSRETTSVNAAPEPVNSPLPVRRKSQTEMVRSTARASMRKAASTLSSNSATEAPAVAPAASTAPTAPAAPLVRERSLAKRIKAPACDRCPHCDRTFNPKAFDRHVEWCKEKAIQATMKSTNSQETSKAKERLEARKQYRPPNLKTKRSLARDKYSGNHEEVLEAGEMTTPKPSLMSHSMTSSVHSDSTQAQVTSSRAGSRAKANSTVTQNQVNLFNEDPPSPPPPKERSALRRSKRTQRESCNEIDEAMEQLRRNNGGDALQLAKLDCVEAPVLQPARRRKRGPKTDKLDAVEKQICLPQVTMTFDELNGLIKRKGGTPICNVEMDEQGIGSLVSKHHSSATLVRQAHRRIRTKENPDLELRALQSSCSSISKDVQSSLVPMQRNQSNIYSGSEEDSPRSEIQIKLETATMRTVCRPQKKSGRSSQVMTNSEPKRALPMSDLKESFEAINQSIGQTVLPRLQMGNERQDYEPEEDGTDNYSSDLDEEPEGDDLMARAAKLIERAPGSRCPVLSPEQVDSHSEHDEEQPEAERELRLPPLTKQNSNVSRRGSPENNESAIAYFKALNSKRRSNRSDSKMPEEKLQRQQSNASSASSQEEKSRQEMEKRPADDDQRKREIFISIETEANAQGRSPISPDSLRHMVGNAQAHIDVLHIENGNEPEHARFSKISDTEDAGNEPRDQASQSTNRLAPSSSGSGLAPNVQLNNAKNLIQQMHSEFRLMGEEASASMRRQLIGSNGGRGEEPQRSSSGLPASNPTHQVVASSPMTPSPSADSDELSSLDGYPVSPSQGLRRGASSKLSSDSAYGSSNSPYSLSRQRSSELQAGTLQSQGLMRPHTASAKLASCMIDASTQAHTDYGTLKARQRLFAPECGNNNGEGGESYSSGSEHSFATNPKQQQNINYNYQQPLQQDQQKQQQMQQMQQQQQMQQMNCNYNYQQEQQQLHHQQQLQHQQQQAKIPTPAGYNTTNNNVPMTPTTSENSLMSTSSMSSSKKSNYCYECGSKFIFETAKFCMDCGLRRAEL
ncbi:uncharacterized protein Dsimw501_GD25497, isoform B [Drosophila simulans]|uniref:Uncharacterized protein, isoform B n=1 Tax=Drosophila simulans TaxID=7240 RepID=A0A0J9RG07_DROSI|nr:uncharacterized protein Dsimw501_GD25497, isoform B [Drosophila simulans]